MMKNCQCRTNPGGDTIVCDECAAKMIEVLNNLLPVGKQTITDVMTPGEYAGMKTLINSWISTLEPSSGRQQVVC